MSTSPPDDGSPAQSDASRNPGAPEGEQAATLASRTGTAAPPPDDLPEWEPLTPELVEDDAIRGDFAMRLVVIGLAILLGCSQIADTKTLIHIRSGEYLAAHGFLPPAKDYLAYTRAELPWVNLSWLFDLVAAGVHTLGGGIALSLFQAIIAAVIFSLLVHTVRPGIRTWWGSICAAFALLACFRQFTVQPELITLLGVATMLWLLLRTQEGSDSRGQWALVPLIWAWSQLDSRAFLGWGLLLLYGLGEAVGSALGRPGFADAKRRKQFWIIAGVSLLAAGLHPFTWHVWTSPGTLYGVEYPAWRASDAVMTRSELGVWPMYLFGAPLREQRFLLTLNHEGVAGIYLIAAALIAMLLNHRRTPIAHVFLFLGINAAAMAASHELAAASLVNCVLATLNAQEWYLARYGQTYSIQWAFLLFSRGGRALTVVSFFALSYLIISGRIDGANGKRTGLGFDEQLQILMTGYERAMQDSYDDRPFSFVVRQGDLLIWAGQKSFIDSRLELFYPGKENSLAALHKKTRSALRARQSGLTGSSDRPHWRKVFDDYQVTHVVARMSGLSIAPSYGTFDDLSKSIDWKLTRLTSAAAVFYRTDLRQDQKLKAYVNAHKVDLTDLAFKDESSPATDPQVWPSVTTTYQKALSLPETKVPGEVSAASHYIHVSGLDHLKKPERIAALLLAIRSARAGLRQEPNSSAGYRTLGTAYAVLDQYEGAELAQYGIRIPNLLRYYQISTAYQNSLLLDPDDPFLHQELAGFFLRLEKPDLALRHLREVIRLRPPTAPENEEQAEQQLAQVTTLAERLEQRLSDIQNEVDRLLANDENRLSVAIRAYQSGALLAAVKILEDDKIALTQSPEARVMLGGWLIEVGRAEEGDQMLRALEPMRGIEQLAGWRDSSVYSAWTQGDYPRVIKLYENAIAGQEQRFVTSALASGPLTATPSSLLPADRYPWMHLIALEESAVRRPNELGPLHYSLALCRLEQGDLPAAKEALHQALEKAPANAYRPLMLLYWYCLTDELLDIEPPDEWIPISKDTFAEEAQP